MKPNHTVKIMHDHQLAPPMAPVYCMMPINKRNSDLKIRKVIPNSSKVII